MVNDMSSQHSSRNAESAAALHRLSVVVDAVDDVPAPVRAGMRARAIADACDRWALPAILLDRLGRVLHVGAAAEPLLADGLAVSAGHLVSDSPAANRAVERAVAAAIGSDPSAGRQAETAGDRAVDVIGLRYHDPSPFQMLRGLLVLGRRAAEGSDEVNALRRLLAA